MCCHWTGDDECISDYVLYHKAFITGKVDYVTNLSTHVLKHVIEIQLLSLMTYSSVLYTERNLPDRTLSPQEFSQVWRDYKNSNILETTCFTKSRKDLSLKTNVILKYATFQLKYLARNM